MATKTITTPMGIARHPHLNRPDIKFADQSKPDGDYKVILEMSSEDAEPFIKQIEAMFADFLASKKAETRKDRLPIATPPWIENDGTVQFKLKVYATWKADKEGKKQSRAPKLFAKDGGATDNIASGTKMQIAVEPYFWPGPGRPMGTKGCGITLQPKAVMIHDLVAWGDGGNASAYGFDVVEAPQPTVKNGTNNGEESIEW